MLLQVLLRLDVALAVNLLLWHFLTVDFDVPTLLPVAQHEGQAACADVLTPPPYPRLRMYLRPRLLAAVTPFAEPLISSKAIEGTYFIV